MKWLRIALLTGGLLVLGAITILVAGSLLSLDWSRQHRAETAALPVLSAGQADGLVRIPANGMSFRARVAGFSGSGPGVILLHGFPETSSMWGPLAEPASAAGFRVIALDQRGYSPGARPDGVASYVVPELIDDVLAVADAAGFERFHLVGHDWGCVVGWGVAIQHPDRVESWAGLSIPHPGALRAELERERPTYIKVFTAPWLPELFFTWNGLALMRQGGYQDMSPEQQREYLALFSEPGALTGALNWYRAIATSLGDAQRVDGPVHVPTLFIYGTGEGWVTPERLEIQRTLVGDPYTELELDAGHWLIQEQTEAVVGAVMQHLDRAGPAP